MPRENHGLQFALNKNVKKKEFWKIPQSLVNQRVCHIERHHNQEEIGGKAQQPLPANILQEIKKAKEEV